MQLASMLWTGKVRVKKWLMRVLKIKRIQAPKVLMVGRTRFINIKVRNSNAYGFYK